MTINKMILIGTVLLMTLALISPVGFGVATPQAFVQPVFHIGFGDAAYASFISLDFPVQGADNHDVQFQNALDSLPEAYGGQIYVWWGDYQFSSQVARDIDNVIWQGVGAATHIDYNGVTPCITAGAQSNWLFRNISVDAGDVTDDDVLVDDSDSNYRIEMWVDGVWTHDIGGTGEGSGNCTQEEVEDYAGNMVSAGTETRITVTYDDAAGMFNFVVDDMNDDVPESGDFGAAADLDADGSITDGVIDEADLDISNAAVDEYVLSYETDTSNFQWKDASAAGDSVSIDGVGVVDPDFVSTGDIDFVDTVNTITADINPGVVGSTEITNDSIDEIDLHIDGAPVDEHVLTYEIDTGNLAWQEGVGDDMGVVNTETELEDALDDVSDVYTDNDGTLWTQEQIEDFIGDMVAGNTETRITVTYEDGDGTIDFVVDDLDSVLTQEEVEDYIGGLINDADGTQTGITVTYDDGTDSLDFVVAVANLNDIGDVAVTNNLGDIIYGNGTHWVDLAIGANNTVLKSDGSIPTWDSVLLTELTGDNWKVIYTDGSGVVVELALGANNTYLRSNGVAVAPTFGALIGDNMGDVDTEAELESTLGDVTDVFTNNDGALDDDDLSDNDITDLGWADDWRIAYSNGDGLQQLAFGDDNGKFLQSQGEGALDFVDIDVSDDLNLTAGDHITLTDDDLDVDDDFLLNDGDTGTGNYDFTGAFFLGAWPFYFEGVTTNNIWTRFAFTDPTGNNTVTFPDASGEVSLLGQEVDISDETNLTAGDYLTLTDDDIDHDPVLRYMPEIFACSMNGNTSSSIGDCESVDFGGIELSVVEYTAGNSTAFFHLKMPIEFGYGGNTTITVSYGIRVEDGSSGTSLIMSTLIGTTIADAVAEGWHNSTAMAWTANDEIYWTADLVVDESLSEGAQDLYFGVNLISEDWDATKIYVDKALFQAWGI